MNNYEMNTQMLIERLINMVGKSHEQMILLQVRITQLECALRETNQVSAHHIH